MYHNRKGILYIYVKPNLYVNSKSLTTVYSQTLVKNVGDNINKIYVVRHTKYNCEMLYRIIAHKINFNKCLLPLAFQPYYYYIEIEVYFDWFLIFCLWIAIAIEEKLIEFVLYAISNTNLKYLFTKKLQYTLFNCLNHVALIHDITE